MSRTATVPTPPPSDSTKPTPAPRAQKHTCASSGGLVLRCRTPRREELLAAKGGGKERDESAAMTRSSSRSLRRLGRCLFVVTLALFALWRPAGAVPLPATEASSTTGTAPATAPTPATPPSAAPSPVASAAPLAAPTPPTSPTPSPASAAPPANPAPTSSPVPSPKARLRGTFDGRVMPEIYDYFAPSGGYKNAYGYLGVRARGALGYEATDWAALVQGQATLLFGMPTHSVAPAPARALGQGGAYYGLALRPDLTTLGFRQAYVRVGRADKSGVTIGRFDYAQGAEVPLADPILDWVRTHRMSKLLVGPLDYNTWGRTETGVRADLDTPSLHLTGLLFQPTQADPHFATNVPNVTVAHGALVFKNGLVPRGEAQIFYNQCNDTRFVPQVDDVPGSSSYTINALGGDKISTLGFQYITRIGTDGDGAAFFAHQGGRWGSHTQDAYAWIAELGLRFPKVPWTPWVRGGYRVFSGDTNPFDGAHGTFIADVGDPRNRYNMYTNANLRELFAQLILSPSKKSTLRLDLRNFHLDRAVDLWYSGAGVVQNVGVNGFAGKPSGGSTNVGTLLEASYENRINAHNLMRLYFAKAFGGPVVNATFPAHTHGHAFNIEYHYLIP